MTNPTQDKGSHILPPGDVEQELVAAVLTSEGEPTTCTIYPRDASGEQRLTTWLSADAGSFVALVDVC